jgi:hypothetical protein
VCSNSASREFAQACLTGNLPESNCNIVYGAISKILDAIALIDMEIVEVAAGVLVNLCVVSGKLSLSYLNDSGLLLIMKQRTLPPPPQDKFCIQLCWVDYVAPRSEYSLVVCAFETKTQLSSLPLPENDYSGPSK